MQRAIFIFLFFLSLSTYSQDFPLVDTTLFEPDDTIATSEDDEETFYFLKNYEATGDTIAGRKIPDSIINDLKADDDFWYANKNLVKRKPKEKKNLGQSQWFQTLLWLVIIAGFAGFLIWYLAGNQFGIFRKKAQVIHDETEAEPGSENIFLINYQKEIDKAVGGKDFRLAIRLMFLRLLKQLADKGKIQYKQDRTNLEYLQQLHQTNYYRDFFQATRNYEYSWYGKFPVSEDAFRHIRTEFDKFDQILN